MGSAAGSVPGYFAVASLIGAIIIIVKLDVEPSKYNITDEVIETFKASKFNTLAAVIGNEFFVDYENG